MHKQSKNKKRTNFLIKCLEICADAEKFREECDCIENLDYFCNAAAILGYDEDKDEEKQEYFDAVELFEELYRNSAINYIIDWELPNSRSKSGDYLEDELQAYLCDNGYFGKHTEQSNQEHRLMAIAFAAAVSETED